MILGLSFLRNILCRLCFRRQTCALHLLWGEDLRLTLKENGKMPLEWPECVGLVRIWPDVELCLWSPLGPHILWPFFTSLPSPGANFEIMALVTKCTATLLGSGSGGKGCQPTLHPPSPPPKGGYWLYHNTQHFRFQNHGWSKDLPWTIFNSPPLLLAVEKWKLPFIWDVMTPSI